MTGTDHPSHVGIVGLTPAGFEFSNQLVALGHEISGADAKVDARRRFENEFAGATYSTPVELFDDGVDAVLVTAPNKFHESAVVSAFERDLPVLIEKPLAHTLESARRILTAAETSEAPGMVTFNHKYLHRSRVLKDYIDQGYFGQISHIHGRHISRRNIPSRGSWMTSQDIAGGGALYDRGTFVVDFVLSLLDYRGTSEVVGRSWRDFGSLDDYAYLEMYGENDTGEISDVDDAAIATLQFENGCSATIEIAWAANVKEDRSHTYDVRGQEAGAHLDISNADEPGNQLEFFEARKGVVDHFLDLNVRTQHVDSKRCLLRDFLEHARSGTTPDMNTIEQAYRVQEIIAQIQEQSGN